MHTCKSLKYVQKRMKIIETHAKPHANHLNTCKSHQIRMAQFALVGGRTPPSLPPSLPLSLSQWCGWLATADWRFGVLWSRIESNKSRLTDMFLQFVFPLRTCGSSCTARTARRPGRPCATRRAASLWYNVLYDTILYYNINTRYAYTCVYTYIYIYI